MCRQTNLDVALECGPTGPIVPHRFNLPAGADWHPTIAAAADRYAHQHIPMSTVASGLNLAPACGDLLASRLDAVGSGLVSPSFLRRKLNGIPRWQPLTHRTMRLRARDIGREVYEVARRDPDLTRHVVSIWARASNSDGIVVLNPQADHVRFAQSFKSFVDALDLDDLTVGLVGYTAANGTQTDIDAWLSALNWPAKTPRRVQDARNTKRESPAQQLGVQAVRRRTNNSYHQDGAFIDVMLLAAGVEIWCRR